jgi:hypothetical protein
MNGNVLPMLERHYVFRKNVEWGETKLFYLSSRKISSFQKKFPMQNRKQINANKKSHTDWLANSFCWSWTILAERIPTLPGKDHPLIRVLPAFHRVGKPLRHHRRIPNTFRIRFDLRHRNGGHRYHLRRHPADLLESLLREAWKKIFLVHTIAFKSVMFIASVIMGIKF